MTTSAPRAAVVESFRAKVRDINQRRADETFAAWQKRRMYELEWVHQDPQARIVIPALLAKNPPPTYSKVQEYWLKRWNRSATIKGVDLEDRLKEVRRFCLSLRGSTPPGRVYFAKGTCWVETPKGAVARLGNSESSSVVFFDRFGFPLAAYKADGFCGQSWAVETQVPGDWRNRLATERLNPLGKSAADNMFGVCG